MAQIGRLDATSLRDAQVSFKKLEVALHRLGKGNFANAQKGWEEPTNVTTDKGMDADNVTIDELADILGTLITGLIQVGVIEI